MSALLQKCENQVKCENLEDISYRLKIQYQLKMLGFINLTTNKKEDLRKLVITDVFPLISKKSNNPWAYKISAKSVGTGKLSSLTVMSRLFNRKPIERMDMIYAQSLNKNAKGYWYLLDYWKI